MSKKFEKFGSNQFGITNSKGEIVTMDYLRRYIHCWCRISDGFTSPMRHEIIESYLTESWLKSHPNLTASQIGKIASKDPRWNQSNPTKKNERTNFVESSVEDSMR